MRIRLKGIYKGFQRLMLTIFFNSYFSWNISKSTVIEIARDAYKRKGTIENMSYQKKN